MNRNDWRTAQDYFSQAYRLGPDNAFSLNNQGYLAEMKGDLESAEDFYREAREAGGAGDRIGIATRPTAEGKKLTSVADESEGQVSTAMEAVSEAKHRNPGPIQLKHRDGSPVVSAPAPSEPESTQQ
jgi:tetratricopeptide (TPR) repeat protein